MDRVRRKEIIGNNRRPWSKKHDESEEKYLFPSIPVELIIEILLKLPAKSIAKFMFVSKYWSSIIRDKYFTELYLTRSFTRPRLLFTVHHQDMQFFYSGSLKDLSSDHHHRRLTITTNHDLWYQFSPPIRGLICCLYGLKVLIGNPSTGQFVTLPRVKTKSSMIYSFFGYDPVNDLYKVLCMTLGIDVPSGGIFGSEMEEHQVFTLGAKQQWRMIECKHRHRLADLGNQGGICMNGVLYYLAKINDELSRSRSIISFNLTSEDFDVIKFPEDIRHGGIWPYNLVNYSGKIALTNYSCNGTLELWVQKDASKQEWSKASSLLVPSWTNLVGDQMFKFGGTLSTGELIFEPFASPNPFFFICYDLKGNNARKVVIEGIMEDLAMIKLFLEHVESPMFLPKVCQSDDD